MRNCLSETISYFGESLMTRKKKVILSIFICIGLIFSMGVLAAYLKSDFLLRRLEQIVSKKLPCDVVVQDIHVDIWAPEIKLNQVRIKSKNNDPIAGCDTLKLKLSYAHFWSKVFQIEQLKLENPWFNFRRSSKKKFSYEQLVPFFSFIEQLFVKPIFHPPLKKPETLLVKSIDITNGQLFFAPDDENQNYFCLKNAAVLAVNDQLTLSGNLAYSIQDQSDIKLMEYQINGTYLKDRLAQTILTLVSSDSPFVFLERFQLLVKNIRFHARANMNLSTEFIQQMPWLSNEISGSIQGNFEFNATSDKPDCQVSIDYNGENIHHLPVNQISLRAKASEKIITIHQANLKTGDDSIDIHGLLDLRKIFRHDNIFQKKDWNNLSWQFFVNTPGFSLAHLHEKIPTGTYLAGKLAVNGQGNHHSFKSQINMNGSVAIPKQRHMTSDLPIDFQLKANATPELLTAITLKGQSAGLAFTANGYFDRKTSGNILFHTNLSDECYSTFGIPKFSGLIDSVLTIKGSLAKPHCQMKLRGKQLAFHAYQLGDCQISAQMTPDRKLTIEKAEWSRLSSKLNINGFAQWDHFRIGQFPKKYAFSVHTNDVQLSDIHPGITGTVGLESEITGMNQIADGSMCIDARSLNIFGQRIAAIYLPIQFSLNEMHVTAGNIQITDHERITISGEIDRRYHYQLQVDSDPIPLSCIKWNLPDLHGKFQLHVQGDGQLKHPKLDGNLTVSSIIFQDQPFPDATFQINTKDALLIFECDSILDVDGHFNPANSDFKIHASAEKMKLSPIFSGLGVSNMDGIINGQFQTTGNVGDLMRGQTRLHMDHVSLTYQELPVLWIDPFDIALVNKNITSSIININFPENGTVKTTIHGKISEPHAQLKGYIPISAIGNFIDSISDIQGQMTIQGDVFDLFTDPLFQGEMNLSDGSFILPWSNQQCHRVQGQVTASKQNFHIKDLSFFIDDGKCEVNGKISFDQKQAKRVDLVVSASAIPVLIPDIAELLVNANLKFTKRNRQQALKGNIELLEGLYYQEISVNQMMLEYLQRKHRPGFVDQLCDMAPWICHTSLDIAINSRLPLIADNDLVYMELNPDLNIRGNINKPVILGRTEMGDGEINYLGKTFVLEKGQLDFVNPYRTEPTIDIKSNVEVDNWQISLDVLGKPEEIQLKLSSTPSEEHADIISILLFGKPTKQLFVPKQKDGPYKSNQQMIAELLSSAFEDNIKNTTGLDTFQLEALEHETTEEDQKDDYKVTMGKELSRRMSITYAFETRKGQLVHYTQANYRILENLIIRGMQDTQGSYGGELLLRLEFH